MNIITGFHAIEERLRSESCVNAAHSGEIYYSENPGPRVKKIIASALALHIKCSKAAKSELDAMVKQLPEYLRSHRGIVLVQKETAATATNIDSGTYQSGENVIDLDDFLHRAAAANTERALVAILDSITDVHNIGAILRSADQFGVSLVLVPKDASPHDIGGNAVIQRASSGASAWVSMCIVNNLPSAVEKLKNAGFWIYGADTRGENIRTVDFAPKAAIVLGSEGSGISRLLKEKCDIIVSIPACGKVDSLNVSVAAGILFYQMTADR
ncbi:MAG: 23S rRNA (guanosine(2251)-2'-O)-methyltransferase RlmB [Treponemataceae bacterium]|nr:MAG: 23S rRNA (guanosine(2251)-2'-O)-methyltransferase RlmB [Treponemataceae bacterium]